MKYYILRTNSVEENLKNTNGYNFKINNLNAERLISDAKDGDIFYLLYNISEKRFIEKGVISSVKSNLPSNKFKALFSNRESLDISYLPFSSPNCGIIPSSKKRINELLRTNILITFKAFINKAESNTLL